MSQKPSALHFRPFLSSRGIPSLVSFFFQVFEFILTWHNYPETGKVLLKCCLAKLDLNYRFAIGLVIADNSSGIVCCRYFRIMHAPIFLRCFASDRRHMKDSLGDWLHQPPLYEPIVSEGKCQVPLTLLYSLVLVHFYVILKYPTPGVSSLSFE